MLSKILLAFTDGTEEDSMFVVQNGLLFELTELLTSTSLELVNECIGALGNLAGECKEYRDIVLSQNILSSVAAINFQGWNSDLIQGLYQSIVWLVLRVCEVSPRPSAHQVKVILPLLLSLLESHEESCHDSIFKSLLNLIVGCPESIDVLLTFGFLPPIIHSVKNSMTISVQEQSLALLGAFSSGTDEHTQMVLDSGILSLLPEVYDRSDSHLQYTCFLLSNIAGGITEHAKAIIDLGILPVLLKRLSRGISNNHTDILKQFIWCLANIASHKDIFYVQYLLEIDALPLFVGILDGPPQSIILGLILRILKDILQTHNSFHPIIKMATEQRMRELTLTDLPDSHRKYLQQILQEFDSPSQFSG